MPGQPEPPHFLLEGMKTVQRRVRDGLRCQAMRVLEAQRPATFGSLGDGVSSSCGEPQCGQRAVSRSLWSCTGPTVHMAPASRPFRREASFSVEATRSARRHALPCTRCRACL